MPARDPLELFAPFFEGFPDPRIDRCKRHGLLEIVILALCATLGNADGWVDIERFCRAKIDFFRTFLDLPRGIPSHDTFGRVFALLEPGALMACIQQWLDALGTAVAGEVCHRRQELAGLVRHCGWQEPLAPGQRLGPRSPPDAGPSPGRQQIQRDHRDSAVAGIARS
jgi:hypothetical protein